jgi:hypothetical protein
VVAQHEHALPQRLVVGEQHAALAGHHRLRAMETERGGTAEAAGAPSPQSGAQGLGGILDQYQTASISDLLQ